MTQTQYKTLTLADMKRRRWETTVQLENKYGAMPRGTKVEVIDKQSGLHVRQLKKCSHCGAQLVFRKISPYDVEEIKA